MAMVYTLVSSAKEWLSEKYGQNGGDEEPEETEAEEEEVYTYSLVCSAFSFIWTGSAVASGDVELVVVHEINPGLFWYGWFPIWDHLLVILFRILLDAAFLEFNAWLVVSYWASYAIKFQSYMSYHAIMDYFPFSKYNL